MERRPPASPTTADARIAQLGVVVGMAIVAVLVIAVALEVRIVELPVDSFVDRLSVFPTVGAISFGVPGAVIVAARPGSRIGWLFLGIGSLLAVTQLGQAYGIVGVHDPSAPLPGADLGLWLASWIWAPAYWAIPTLLLLLFPDGELPSPAWRPAAWTAAAAIMVSTVGWLALPAELMDVDMFPAGYADPFPSSATVADAARLVGAALGAVAAGSAVASLVWRYRRAGRGGRDQIKWVLAAAIVTILLLTAALLAPRGGSWLLGLAAVPLPVAAAVAVLRHRLWDVDRVLARSLTLGLLTVVAFVVYLGGVSLLGRLIGQGLGASLAATAVVAVAAYPVHERLRRMANRLVYGERDDPAAALRSLGARLDASGSPADLLSELTATVARTLRAPYVAVEAGARLTAATGAPTGTIERVGLTHRGNRVGTLVVGMAPGERLERRDRQLLDDLAPHVAVVVQAERLLGDLEHSHQRLLATRDDERARLRRDLHDGLGPTLAALALQVDRGRTLVTRDPAGAERVLDDLAERIRQAVGAVRGIVDQLDVPVLAEDGLSPAIEAVAAQFRSADFGVTVVIDDLPPLPAHVEVAIHRIVAEAVTNAARHSRGRTCTIRLAGDDGRLEVTVSDDGHGLAPDVLPGVGLMSMRLRAAEIGGSLHLSTGAAGTTIQVVVPAPAPSRGDRSVPAATAGP